MVDKEAIKQEFGDARVNYLDWKKKSVRAPDDWNVSEQLMKATTRLANARNKANSSLSKEELEQLQIDTEQLD
jgi:hypothetical protein